MMAEDNVRLLLIDTCLSKCIALTVVTGSSYLKKWTWA